MELASNKIINLKTKKMEKSGKIILANLEAKAQEYMPENKKKHFKNKCWERIMAEIENLKELPYHFTNEDYANLREEVNTGNDDFRYMINDFAYIDVQYYQSEIKYDCRFIDGTELNSDFNKNFLKKL